MGLRAMPSNPIQSDSILSPIQKILTATVFVASFLDTIKSPKSLVIFLKGVGRGGLWGFKTSLLYLGLKISRFQFFSKISLLWRV